MAVVVRRLVGALWSKTISLTCQLRVQLTWLFSASHGLTLHGQVGHLPGIQRVSMGTAGSLGTEVSHTASFPLKTTVVMLLLLIVKVAELFPFTVFVADTSWISGAIINNAIISIPICFFIFLTLTFTIILTLFF